MLRDDFRLDCGIDVVVEFKPDRRIGFLELAGLESELSKLFGNRRVNLRTPQDLSRYFRDEILATAQALYAGNRPCPSPTYGRRGTGSHGLRIRANTD